MNAHAGVRHGHCQTRGCACSRYSWSDGSGRPSCECSHPYRNHAQVWRDEERPLVTVAGWFPGAA